MFKVSLAESGFLVFILGQIKSWSFVSKNKSNSSKRGDLNNKTCFAQETNNDEYCQIKTVKLYGLIRKVKIKANNYSDFVFVNVKYKKKHLKMTKIIPHY